MGKPLVLYHGGGCFDGFCCAWLARKYFGDIEAIPVQYGEAPPIKECDREVYILDFSYPREVMKGIIGQSKSVVVLDHHRTAEVELRGLAKEYIDAASERVPAILFDVTRSGGRMTWEFFFGSKRSPWLVDYTEDRDLWRWALPSSRQINANLRSLPMDFAQWDRLNEEISFGFASNAEDSFIAQGGAILRREKQIVDEHARHAQEIEMDGYKVLAVNATVLMSEIAGELAKGRAFGVCWFQGADGKRHYSLRSAPDGVDVSEIARKHGGGGHRHASGFEEASL